MPTGLYVHIPFCAKKCHYCNFVIALSGNPRLHADFLSALEAEAAEARRRYGPVLFDTVYLGGGTPSAISAGEMEKVFSILQKHFSWKPGAEITCEVNPGDVDEEKLRTYRRLGVNRISLGVQSTNDRLLKAMNRAHTAEDARRTARLIRDLGFDNVSMDLIIRLPNQEVGDITRSISDMVEWNAQQVVVYDLAVHEDTHFGNLQQKRELILPDEAAHEEMFQAVESGLIAAGLAQYEIASFAKPGYESRHNLLYWNNQPYLGLGPGAFSYMDGVRYQYARSVSSYLEKTAAGDRSNDEQDVLGAEEKEMETLLTGLRLRPGIDLSRLPLLRERLEPEAAALAAAGLVEYDAPVIRLTRKGRYLAESLLARLASLRTPSSS